MPKLIEGPILGGFEFPPLGDTGKGPPPYPVTDQRERGAQFGETHGPCYVLHQNDNAACAFRCHYPGGSSPCDEETAVRFLAWAREKVGA